MFLPVATDRRKRHVPWVTYALIAANVVIFLFTARDVSVFGPAVMRGIPLQTILSELPVVRFYLWPNQPQLYQFISYQFLHQDWMHLFFNMLFLWVFGNDVEERLGKWGYLFFYLSAGVLAGFAHCLPGSAGPLLGASGAVAGVTGAYLALFPMAEITLVLFVFGAIELPALVIILFRIVQDATFQVLGIGNVAYSAHLTGYAYGFIVAMGLLLARVLPREAYDMISLIEHRWRRYEFRRLTRGGAYPWDLAKPTDPVPGATPPTLSPQQQAIMDRRAAITQALNDHRWSDASEGFLALLKLDPRQVMSQQQQLDIANQLMKESRYFHAATAYEQLLATYPVLSDRPKVQLVLALIYARNVGEKGRARELLKESMAGLFGDDRALAQQVLHELDAPKAQPAQ